LGPLKVVLCSGQVSGQLNSLFSVEFASVLISAEDADGATEDFSVLANAEVVWHVGVPIGLQNDLSFEEGTLGHASVRLLGLSHHDRLVLQVVEDGDLSDAVVLKTGLHHGLLEVTVESQDLFVELDVGGLEELLNLSASEVVGELVVRIGHARSVLEGLGVEDRRLGDGVEGHRLVLSVPDLVKMHVRDLLVCDNGRVVRGCVPRQLGEVL